jgi:hypothetical protein
MRQNHIRQTCTLSKFFKIIFKISSQHGIGVNVKSKTKTTHSTQNEYAK